MGSGEWFKNIIRSKKEKNGKAKSLKGSSAPQISDGFIKEPISQKESTKLINGSSDKNLKGFSVPDEDIAAIRIQSAFRAYKARKMYRHLKGIVRLQTLTLGSSVRKQASNTLSHLHTWSRIQAEIRARRIGMATEARIKRKKLENHLKLEAKMHDLEVEWSGGPETMDEVLARIHLREEAALKRERTLAYAFSHQWRANSDLGLGNYELGKAIWGWSWMERWIAARPWENRVIVQSPKKVVNRQASKNARNTKSPTMKSLNSGKSISPNGKKSTKARKLSYGGAEQEANKKEPVAS